MQENSDILTTINFSGLIKDKISRPELFYKIGALKNFAKFSGKHLWQSLFFNKVAETCNFIKKDTLAQVFSCKFWEIFKNTFLTEHLRWLLLQKENTWGWGCLIHQLWYLLSVSAPDSVLNMSDSLNGFFK